MVDEKSVPEKIDVATVDKRVRATVDKCLKKESKLLELDANERSSTHKIAEYLQGEFKQEGYDVDCEYNRDRYDTKKLRLEPMPILSDNSKGDTVFPDIIIHRRGTRNNLVVIEAKKSTNGDKSDSDKLHAFKEQLGYKLCYRLVVYAG